MLSVPHPLMSIRSLTARQLSQTLNSSVCRAKATASFDKCFLSAAAAVVAGFPHFTQKKGGTCPRACAQLSEFWRAFFSHKLDGERIINKWEGKRYRLLQSPKPKFLHHKSNNVIRHSLGISLNCQNSVVTLYRNFGMLPKGPDWVKFGALVVSLTPL